MRDAFTSVTRAFTSPGPLTAQVVRLRTWCVAAVTLLAYVGAVPSGFAYDDRSVLLENLVIQGFAPLHSIFFRDWWGHVPAQTVGSYRPLALFTLWLDWHVGGWFKALTGSWLGTHCAAWVAAHGSDLRAWPMHLVNVLLHVAVVVLIYRVLRLLASEATALGAALLCAVVVAPAEVVQGLVGRADLLETIGLVGGLWAHRRMGARWGALAAGGLLLALGCKETGIMALAAWPALDLILPDPASPWRKRLGRYAGYAGVVLVYLAFRRAGIGTLHLPRTPNALYNPLLVADAPSRIFGAGHIFLERYVLGLLDPRRRLYDCSAQACTASTAADPIAWGGLLLFAALLLLPLLLRRRLPLVAAGLAWAMIFFAPVSNFFFPATLTYGERLLYVPMMGIALATVELLRRLGRAGWVALWLLVVVNAAFLQARHGDWRSDATLAASGLRYSADSVVVLENNATAAIDRKEYAEAEAFSRRATELVPTDAYAHKALAVALYYQGRNDVAEAEFRQALALERRSDIVYDFANFLAKQRRYQEALAEVQRQYREHPLDFWLGDLEKKLERALERSERK